jgi:hypothetical protein
MFAYCRKPSTKISLPCLDLPVPILKFRWGIFSLFVCDVFAPRGDFHHCLEMTVAINGHEAQQVILLRIIAQESGLK